MRIGAGRRRGRSALSRGSRARSRRHPAVRTARRARRADRADRAARARGAGAAHSPRGVAPGGGGGAGGRRARADRARPSRGATRTRGSAGTSGGTSAARTPGAATARRCRCALGRHRLGALVRRACSRGPRRRRARARRASLLQVLDRARPHPALAEGRHRHARRRRVHRRLGADAPAALCRHGQRARGRRGRRPLRRFLGGERPLRPGRHPGVVRAHGRRDRGLLCALLAPRLAGDRAPRPGGRLRGRSGCSATSSSSILACSFWRASAAGPS